MSQFRDQIEDSHHKSFQSDDEIGSNTKEKTRAWLWFFVVLLFLTNIATLTFWFYQKPKPVSSNEQTQEENQESFKNEEEVLKSEDDVSEHEAEVVKTGPENDREEKLNTVEGEISVDWKEWPVVVDYWSLFNYEKVKEIFERAKQNPEYMIREEKVEEFLSNKSYYKVGVIRDGEFKDKEIFIITYRPEGPAFRDNMFRVIKNDKELVLLDSYSDQAWGIYKELFSLNDSLVIANLEPFDEIKVPDSDMILIKNQEEPMKLLSHYDDPELLFEYQGKSVYKSHDDNCFIVRANDGTVRDYYYDLGFVQNKEVDSLYTISPNLLDITWENGKKNSYDYMMRYSGGCSISNCLNYVDYIDNEDQLVLSGKTSTGDDIYELRDVDIKDERMPGKSVLRNMFDMAYMGEEEGDYEDFLQDHPIIYWQDPFGDFAEFRNAKYQPMAECGKPVIYLYPEKEMDARVYVEPSGGFTVTEPLYKNGWLVRAQPDGELYNYDDKETYPYLFWEGYGNDYKRPEEGFVVARQDMELFLIEKLSILGLVEKEYDEFIEFWLPKMQDKPYYFVTFMPQEDFEKIAPLTVYPKPDTVIRVFMDYEGLNKPIKVKEQTLKSSERIGFTVVEWGGELHR